MEIVECLPTAGCQTFTSTPLSLFATLVTTRYIWCLLGICLLFSPSTECKLTETKSVFCSLLSPQNPEVSGTEDVFNKYFCMKAFCSVMCVVKFVCHLPHSSSLETAGFTLGSCVTLSCWLWKPDLSWTSEHASTPHLELSERTQDDSGHVEGRE